ncbi:hypothetical protein L1987_80266 [Smallanthus sonchifolius]|uniref:Uncharacterized protein n=1 Tax=Smallanthus sonchifolius TaxID=185202 RepID=A0ACB8YM92_9ASTR|nr:hypothetical protein L1987_80266 [Smallanthus sonchifolius]
MGKCFRVFERIADIYVAARKDISGNYFGFVRFTGVEDKWEMEKAMQEIMGKEEHREKPFIHALLRNQNTTVPRRGVFVPEDADYDEGLNVIKLKYLGGLHVLLIFGKYSEANEFVDEEQRWSDVLPKAEILVFDKIASSIGKVVVPSHATFSNGTLTRDMVGIMVKKEWNIKEEITLQWRDRAYTLLCKEDDDGWCQNWCKESPTIVMATPAPATVREQQEEGEKVPAGNLDPRKSQGSPPHGNFKSACMGINVMRTKEKKSMRVSLVMKKLIIPWA